MTLGTKKWFSRSCRDHMHACVYISIHGPYTCKEIGAAALVHVENQEDQTQQPTTQSFSCGHTEIHDLRTNMMVDVPTAFPISTQSVTPLRFPTAGCLLPGRNCEIRSTAIRHLCNPYYFYYYYYFFYYYYYHHYHYCMCQGTGKRSRRLVARPRELVKQWTCTFEGVSLI